MDQLWACELEHLQNYCEKVLRASPETEKNAALFFQTREDRREILTVAGDTAIIDIKGTLTDNPSVIGTFLRFHTTSYSDIRAAIETIEADDMIKKVRLVIDSPGGVITGLDETWMVLKDLAKTRDVVAENHGIMASGAYWLATAADRIVATSPSAETGSIGVRVLIIDFSKMDERVGIKEIHIVSKNAPDKVADAATKEGLKVWQERLDALERVFISRVSEGRKVSAETVEKTFGRGGLLIAQDPDASKPSALSVGMIDKVLGIAAGRGKDDKRRAEETGDISAGSPPFKNYAIVDKPWNASAAIKRVRTKTGSTEKPSASYKNAFFWYDPADSEEFGAYKLPFVDVVGGTLKAVRRGVFAAKGSMAGARGQKPKIPPADVGGVNKHIDKYVQKIEKEDKAKKQGSAAADNREGSHMKYSDLEAADPELKAEVDGMIEAGKQTPAPAAAPPPALAVEPAKPSEVALKALETGSGPYIKALATKVLKGEATEAELTAAQAALDAAEEKRKADAAAGETGEQGATPPAPPAAGAETGEIKTEEDHQAQVARFRGIQGQEAS